MADPDKGLSDDPVAPVEEEAEVITEGKAIHKPKDKAIHKPKDKAMGPIDTKGTADERHDPRT